LKPSTLTGGNLQKAYGPKWDLRDRMGDHRNQ